MGAVEGEGMLCSAVVLIVVVLKVVTVPPVESVRKKLKKERMKIVIK